MKIICINILLIGDISSRKTDLINRYIGKKSDEDNSINMAGLELLEKIIYINNYQIRLVIIDSSGQDKFKFIKGNYYQDADGIICGYCQ